MDDLKADSKLINWLINSDESANQIAKKLHQNRANITNLRNGRVEIGKVSFNQAVVLSKYAKEMLEDKKKAAINEFLNTKRYYLNEIDEYGGHIDIFPKNRLVDELINDIPELIKLEFDPDYQAEKMSNYAHVSKAQEALKFLVKSQDNFVILFCKKKIADPKIYQLRKEAIQKALISEKWLTSKAKEDLTKLLENLPTEI